MIPLMSVTRNFFMGREPTKGRGLLKRFDTENANKIAVEEMRKMGINLRGSDQAVGTLSGGESQRIRLATQIGSKLMGVLYVLDEPSIGLHQRDNERLIATLKGMRDLGNSVLVVEHDEGTIRAADWVVDLGPGAGEHGGEVVAAGTPEDIERDGQSLTGRYLRREGEGPRPPRR